MSKQRSEEEIIKEAHAYRDALDRREERKEVYLMVAKALIAVRRPGTHDDTIVQSTDIYAEAIYQGLIKFVGDKT